MQRQISFTPAGRRLDAASRRTIRKRHVLYVPGYDPEAAPRTRMLFVRELVRYAKRFGLSERTVSRNERLPDLPGLRWTVTTAKGDWATETTVEVLLWDDIVQRDFRRPLPIVLGLMIASLVYYLASGMLVRWFRVHWKMGGIAIYPPVMIAAGILVALVVGLGVDASLASLVEAPGPARWALVAGIGGLVFCALYPFGERRFVWHLMHDFVFNWQHGTGLRRDCDERVDRFADHLVALASRGEADEILVVGHSSGSTMALDVVGRAIERSPGLSRGPSALSLLTIGTCVPLVVFNPAARAFRRRMRGVMTNPSVLWVEYQAWQDWINFAGFNPARDLRLGLSAEEIVNPVIRSPRFREIVAPETYKAIVFRPFRLHFQFMMANDVPGEYDFQMMCFGPVSLLERVARSDEVAQATLGAWHAATGEPDGSAALTTLAG